MNQRTMPWPWTLTLPWQVRQDKTTRIPRQICIRSGGEDIYLIRVRGIVFCVVLRRRRHTNHIPLSYWLFLVCRWSVWTAVALAGMKTGRVALFCWPNLSTSNRKLPSVGRNLVGEKPMPPLALPRTGLGHRSKPTRFSKYSLQKSHLRQYTQAQPYYYINVQYKNKSVQKITESMWENKENGQILWKISSIKK